jgi:transcriptional regulator CtsR
METKVIRGLWEAYNEVYASQELTEEVEIATEYFYNLGLNEDGMQIVVEELGLDEFSEWIDDIIEEYTLTEESKTRLQTDRALKGPKGSRPQSTTKARIKKQGGSTRMSTDSAPKSVMRKSAVAKAKKSQEPDKKDSTETKKGIGGFIGSIMQRAKQDTELLKKSVQTAKDVATKRGAEAKAVYDAVRARGREAEQSAQATRARRKATVAAGRAAQSAGKTAIKAAGAAGAAAGEGVKARRQGKSGAAIAGRVAGTFVKKMSSEDYEYILSHLIDEGYANTEDAAIMIAENMSEDWIDNILEAHPVDRQRLARQKGRPIPSVEYQVKPKPRRKSVGD